MEIAPHALLDITNPATSATRVEVEKQVLPDPLPRLPACQIQIPNKLVLILLEAMLKQIYVLVLILLEVTLLK